MIKEKLVDAIREKMGKPVDKDEAFDTFSELIAEAEIARRHGRSLDWKTLRRTIHYAAFLQRESEEGDPLAEQALEVGKRNAALASNDLSLAEEKQQRLFDINLLERKYN